MTTHTPLRAGTAVTIHSHSPDYDNGKVGYIVKAERTAPPAWYWVRIPRGGGAEYPRMFPLKDLRVRVGTRGQGRSRTSSFYAGASPRTIAGLRGHLEGRHSIPIGPGHSLRTLQERHRRAHPTASHIHGSVPPGAARNKRRRRPAGSTIRRHKRVR